MMFNYCKHEYKILRANGALLFGKHWKELQEQAMGNNLFALMTVDLSNEILAEMLGNRKRWVFALQSKHELKALQELSAPFKLVGIYAMDCYVLDQLHQEAHAEEEEMDDEFELVDPSELAGILQGLGARFGGRLPMTFEGELSDL